MQVNMVFWFSVQAGAFCVLLAEKHTETTPTYLFQQIRNMVRPRCRCLRHFTRSKLRKPLKLNQSVHPRYHMICCQIMPGNQSKFCLEWPTRLDYRDDKILQ